MMSLKILGVSGSPIPNSNTDRAVKAILDASGHKSEFVKLSDTNVRPCLACKRCVPDNICKQEDDFQALALKVREAKALVIGAYCPYGQIDAFTKAFLERLWSMRHVNNLNNGKLVVIVTSGVANNSLGEVNSKEMNPMAAKFLAVFRVSAAIETSIRMERMNVIGSVKIRGNTPCLTCGEGTNCKMSGIPLLFGKGTVASSDLCVKMEDQRDVTEEISRLGKELHDRLS